jgi:hypothetical protein
MQHGSKIMVASTFGQGSSFTVILPLLNRGDMVDVSSEGKQAHAAENLESVVPMI